MKTKQDLTFQQIQYLKSFIICVFSRPYLRPSELRELHKENLISRPEPAILGVFELTEKGKNILTP